MELPSFQESELIAYNNAIAGHEGVLSDRDGVVIIKPCTQAEIDFYDEAKAFHPDLYHVMPTYMGSLRLGAQPGLAGAPEPETPAAAAEDDTGANLSNRAQHRLSALSLMLPNSPTLPPPHDHNDHADIPKAILPSTHPGRLRGRALDTGLCIVLSNADYGFKKPNFLDVKLGAQLWDAQAEPAKRARLDRVAAETTSGSLGFRICGMKVWQGDAAAGQDGVDHEGYKLYGKVYGRSLNANTVVDAFRDYLHAAGAGLTVKLAQTVATRLAGEVRLIQGILESEESRMYSASILFVYEGDGKSLQEALDKEARLELQHRDKYSVDHKDEVYNDDEYEVYDDDDDDDGDEHADSDDDADDYDDDDDSTPRICEAKLIDFAHATFTPGQGPDENALRGVREVRRILDKLAHGGFGDAQGEPGS